jgi:hypothetical protein
MKIAHPIQRMNLPTRSAIRAQTTSPPIPAKIATGIAATLYSSGRVVKSETRTMKKGTRNKTVAGHGTSLISLKPQALLLPTLSHDSSQRYKFGA